MNTNPIAIVDSGSGGLSVWKSIRLLLPQESIIYLGDHAYLPYGEKTSLVIKERMIACIRSLVSQQVKLVVVACNTATVAGISYFRSVFPDIPIVGVVPVVKTAARESTRKHFIVLSTTFTAESDYQKDLIKKWAPDCIVHNVGSSVLVPLIEKGNLLDPQISKELERMVHAVDPEPYDVIVLGCTHYPFVRDKISAIVGNTVRILDSGDAVARQVQRILTTRNELSNSEKSLFQFQTTGDSENVERVYRMLLQDNLIKVTHVTI